MWPRLVSAEGSPASSVGGWRRGTQTSVPGRSHPLLHVILPLSVVHLRLCFQAHTDLELVSFPQSDGFLKDETPTFRPGSLHSSLRRLCFTPRLGSIFFYPFAVNLSASSCVRGFLYRFISNTRCLLNRVWQRLSVHRNACPLVARTLRGLTLVLLSCLLPCFFWTDRILILFHFVRLPCRVDVLLSSHPWLTRWGRPGSARLLWPRRPVVPAATRRPPRPPPLTPSSDVCFRSAHTDARTHAVSGACRVRSRSFSRADRC